MPEVVEEARRLIADSADAGVPLRLAGGVAVRVHSEPLHPAFARDYKDIDFVTLGGRGGEVAELVEGLGYRPEVEFNALNGYRRLRYASDSGVELDVFVGEFSMCHRIPVTERIERDPVTVPLAELLLTKLQIVELGIRDVQDAVALLHHHELADHDEDAINVDRVAELCAADWGLWRTSCMTIERLRDRLPELELDAVEQERDGASLERLRDRLESEPKTRRWRMRARVGERKRWYELPEEVG